MTTTSSFAFNHAMIFVSFISLGVHLALADDVDLLPTILLTLVRMTSFITRMHLVH